MQVEFPSIVYIIVVFVLFFCLTRRPSLQGFHFKFRLLHTSKYGQEKLIDVAKGAKQQNHGATAGGLFMCWRCSGWADVAYCCLPCSGQISYSGFRVDGTIPNVFFCAIYSENKCNRRCMRISKDQTLDLLQTPNRWS